MISPEPPAYEIAELAPKRTRVCFLTVTWNEGDRIRNQLRRMSANAGLADILVADGDSHDGSTDRRFLESCGVRALLVTRERGLGTALRTGLHYALEQGYEGVVTVDANGKDGVEALPELLRLLDEGYDFVQGSRFLPGGRHANTPVNRHLAIRLVCSPLIWLASRCWYTDPTNGFKALSRRFLVDPRVQPIRRVFERFNLQLYLNVRAPKLGFRVIETPVTRVYPADGSVPTKITSMAGKGAFFKELALTALGAYNPRPVVRE